MPQVLDALARGALRVAAAGTLGGLLGSTLVILAQAGGALVVFRAASAGGERALAAHTAHEEPLETDSNSLELGAHARHAIHIVAVAVAPIRDLGRALERLAAPRSTLVVARARRAHHEVASADARKRHTEDLEPPVGLATVFGRTVRVLVAPLAVGQARHALAKVATLRCARRGGSAGNAVGLGSAPPREEVPPLDAVVVLAIAVIATLTAHGLLGGARESGASGAAALLVLRTLGAIGEPVAADTAEQGLAHELEAAIRHARRNGTVVVVAALAPRGHLCLALAPRAAPRRALLVRRALTVHGKVLPAHPSEERRLPEVRPAVRGDAVGVFVAAAHAVRQLGLARA